WVGQTKPVRVVLGFRLGWVNDCRDGHITMAMEKICTLPENEREKSFKLLVSLLGVSDGRRRSEEVYCNHWWHRDLSDDEVVRDILNKGG
ncbi:MAG: hypothetical protein HRU19_32670, partial [Pseudobacteriovorax sp.]|nr:hypothetical protein [Pseudobacteriovorax sp.]